MNADRLVKLAMEALAEDRWWDFADAVLEEVPDARGESSSPDANDGSRAALAELSKRLEHGTGHRLSVKRLAVLRATARAWPPRERDAEVEFAVHERLRGPAAKGQLAMFKRRAREDYERAPGYQGSPHLTIHRLQVYRQEERAIVPWSAQVAKAVTRLVNKPVTLEALDELVRLFDKAVDERRKQLSG